MVDPRRWIPVLLAIAACDSDSKDVPDPTSNTPPQTTPVSPPADCSAHEYDGEIYDCLTFDPCDASPAAVSSRLACCDCDPIYCQPPTDCPTTTPPEPSGGCMACHNGSPSATYSGPGLQNPHLVDNPAAQYLLCATCHGGDEWAAERGRAHVPPPPQVGDSALHATDPTSYFAYLTRTGIDRLPDYVVDGTAWQAIDYLQFLNPGDARVVAAGRSCGQAGCHDDIAEWFSRSPIAGGAGMLSAATFAFGVPNAVPAQQGLYEDSAADYAFRAASDPSWVYDPAPEQIGRIGEVVALPELGGYGAAGGIWEDPAYASADLPAQRDADDRVLPGSPLEGLVFEALGATCAGCHAGSAGRNDTFGAYRSSGCTGCHMPYAASGRYGGTDPNLPQTEPLDPAGIEAPERPHVRRHVLSSVSRVVQGFFGPVLQPGVDDLACNTCHMGTNYTVLQYWGIRVDPNRDLAGGTQYPTPPASWSDAGADDRLFDPALGNTTFGGLTAEQLVALEDYDGDGRDDTPPDIHHERGMGCIDCHGARDLHGGLTYDDASGAEHLDPTSGRMMSRGDQTVGITCASCHGTVEQPALTVSCTAHDGAAATCAADRFGNPLRHVLRDPSGDLWLRGRLDGAPHYVPQVRDVVVDTGAAHPLTGQLLYSANASFAMGTADGDPANGTGPEQADPALYTVGFSHLDRLACASCHVTWTTTCFGCHLELAYDADPANTWLSNLTGERIALRVDRAEPVYTSPVWSVLEVGPSGRIEPGAPGRGTFFRYVDLDGVRSEVLTFGDRNGRGSVPGAPRRDALPAMAHDKVAAHSVRGRATAEAEGARQCVACHLDQDQLATWGAGYATFFEGMAAGDRSVVDFELLAGHIGRNPGNQLGSPYYVHMAAGLGTGLALFDAAGCPVNPLDGRADRCEVGAPAAAFDLGAAAFDLDGLVEPNGSSNASRSHPLRDPVVGAPMRLGDDLPALAGPLGILLTRRLADPDGGLVLDTWVDADGVSHP